MDLNKLEQDLAAITQINNQDEFIFDLLLAYDSPKASITLLKKGNYNLAKDEAVLWKKKVYFRVETEQDLHLSIDQAQHDQDISKQQPRFIIVTDFKTLLAVDTKAGDSLDIPFNELSQNYTFFLPWAGMEKTQIQGEALADRKAAEKLAQLYDIIIQENEINDDQRRHGLNIFLSRLLFCFFAEDTGIFDDNQFTNGLASHTNDDGSDLKDYLIALFNILNVKTRSDEPAHLTAFPYVNGGLFAANYPAPRLNAKARKMIVEAGSLNWKQINPDIFGSMMQAVVHRDQRGSLGMHYTSVVNIRKVIDPLFMNDLRQQLEDAESNEKKLIKLLDRLYHLRLFDPACGSGNFLIIAYKELCQLEIEIYQQLQAIDNKWLTAKSGIRLTQFYGIELDDFAQETAKLSLWLAEHQMNIEFKDVFGSAKPTLPLQDSGYIVCGNATRLDWETVCPKDKGVEIYIMGNPPYLGARYQENKHRSDMTFVLGNIQGYKRLDYISIWFFKGSNYITNTNSKLAFVTTNSITQGEQVVTFWPEVLGSDIEIDFAHTSFKWTNNAKGNAGVTVVIIGLRNASSKAKYLFSGDSQLLAKNINPFLTTASNTFIKKRTKPLYFKQKIERTNPALDDGHFLLNENEKQELLNAYPLANKLVKSVVGAAEFLRGVSKYCLWINDSDLDLAKSIEPINKKIEKVRSYRLKRKSTGSKNPADFPHQFLKMKLAKKQALFLPTVSSERREYIPVGFLDNDTVIIDPNFAIYDPDPYIFAVISSRMHMTWVRAVAGRLETRIRYSSTLCYNTFPFPNISEAQKATLEEHVFKVLDAREQHSEKTMAQLYDPDLMPDGLRQAHHAMDLAVEQCYRKQPFKSDEERLEYLFKLYETMIAAENT